MGRLGRFFQLRRKENDHHLIVIPALRRIFLLIAAFLWAMILSRAAFSQEVSSPTAPSTLITVPPEKQTVTFDFKNTDIKDVLRAIATSKGINIVPEPNVVGNVTIHLDNVPLEIGLKTLLEANGFSYQVKDGVYRIFKTEPGKLMVVSFRDGLLSLDLRQVDIQEAMIEIAKKTGVNLVADRSVTGKVNIHLDTVPLEQALLTFLNANGYLLAKGEGNIYRITAVEKGVPLAMSISEGTVTLDVKDADLGEIVRQIASQSGLNLIMYGPVREPVNARFQKIFLDEAMSLLFRGSKYAYKREGNILMVGDPTLNTPAGHALTIEKLIKLKYIDSAQVMGLLPASISPANVKVVPEQNAILVTGTDSLIRDVEEFTEFIDHPSKQITVEALVVEYSKDSRLNLEVTATGQKQRLKADLVSAGELTVGLQMSGVARLPEDFQARLIALASKGKARIVTSPKLTTVNGKEATINVGDIRYFETSTVSQQTVITQLQTVTAAIILRIKPWVNASGEITVELHPEISGVSATGPRGLPEITKRTVDTTVRIKDGETIVIGGLIRTEDTKTSDRIPVLGDIPLLGAVFGRTKNTKTERELVIYITPKLVTEADRVDLQKIKKEEKVK